eukprot:356225-Chlamydomonas_euryale.AAC.12
MLARVPRQRIQRAAPRGAHAHVRRRGVSRASCGVVVHAMTAFVGPGEHGRRGSLCQLRCATARGAHRQKPCWVVVGAPHRESHCGRRRSGATTRRSHHAPSPWPRVCRPQQCNRIAPRKVRSKAVHHDRRFRVGQPASRQQRRRQRGRACSHVVPRHAAACNLDGAGNPVVLYLLLQIQRHVQRVERCKARDEHGERHDLAVGQQARQHAALLRPAFPKALEDVGHIVLADKLRRLAAVAWVVAVVAPRCTAVLCHVDNGHGEDLHARRDDLRAHTGRLRSMHTCTYDCMSGCARVKVHACMDACTHGCMQACTCWFRHACMYGHMNKQIPACARV